MRHSNVSAARQSAQKKQAMELDFELFLPGISTYTIMEVEQKYKSFGIYLTNMF